MRATPAADDNALALRLSLAFSGAEFERRFVAHYVDFYYRFAQVSLALGLVLVFADFLVDYVARPADTANLYRLTVCLPILATGIAYSFTQFAKRHWQPIMAAFIAGVSLSMFWVLLTLDQQGGNGLKSWVGILNFTFLEFYCFVILGVQFRYALVSGLVILAAFEAAVLIGADERGAEIAYWSYHIVTLFMLAAAIGWWREYVLRKDYSTSRSLDEARVRAETLAKAKSDFLANMSHEIRTPMNAIVGFTQVLMRHAHSAEQAANLERINAATQHLLSIVNDILDLSKIEAGKLSLESIDFSLSAVLDNARWLLAGPARAKRLTITIECDGVPEWFLGDPTRLGQAVINYAANAVKFTESGGIVLRCRLLQTVGDNFQLRFEVQDTGIGITSEKLAGLFKPFEQADTSTTRMYGGTGLGLAITRQIAALMKGEAGAHSVPGVGSTFWFTTWLRRGSESRNNATATVWSDADAVLRRNHGGARVLLVDDDATNREVALALLAESGLVIETASNGKQALALAAGANYDAILMDMQMPEMDGVEAARAIRQLAGHENTPMVAMTASAFKEDRDQCIAAGMNGFVPKPIDRDLLLTTLLGCLAGHTAPVTPGPAVPPNSTLDADLAVFDANMLGSLVGDNRRVVRKLLADYLAAARTLVAQLVDASAIHDMDKVNFIAHRLKSSSRAVGALALGTLCEELERAGRLAAPGAVAKCAPLLVPALMAVEREINAGGQQTC
jgi:signal transduction histidine kinase/CheY-like chemotaxis protein/HPt (histidine-containing phosphotransfer) domain-containing protein